MFDKNKMHSICAKCDKKTCSIDSNDYPKWCLQGNGNWLTDALKKYEKEENMKLYKTAAHIETTGYKKWPRLKEIAEYAIAADFKNIGIAFCIGLEKEAKIATKYFEGRGLEVNSAVCSCGSIDKADLDIPPEDRFSPEGFEAGCNPIGQANLLAECETDFNVVLGLCVGHDSLFFKHSKAPTTVLAVKDRVLGHNPLVAVYQADSYYSHLYESEEN
ncbi:MAG TPA: DUF1847 domain-containing protein [Halanaerobiales bacterium]|nr:DUF1847 domain-containing protein [Halanaerobiales bacterium]